MLFRSWLSQAGIAGLATRCVEAGGRVNEAATAGGTEPYELAATWRSLCEVGVGAPFAAEELAARIVAGHAVALALAGIPLVYAQSPAGGANATERAERSGVARDLNRARFVSPQAYLAALADDPVGGSVWPQLRAMLGWRRERAAFHPEAAQQLVDAPAGVVAIRRGAGDDEVLAVTNLTGQPRSLAIGFGWRRVDGVGPVTVDLALGPWEVAWFDRTADPPVSQR